MRALTALTRSLTGPVGEGSAAPMAQASNVTTAPARVSVCGSFRRVVRGGMFGDLNTDGAGDRRRHAAWVQDTGRGAETQEKFPDFSTRNPRPLGILTV